MCTPSQVPGLLTLSPDLAPQVSIMINLVDHPSTKLNNLDHHPGADLIKSGELENCGCDRSLRGMSPEGFQVMSHLMTISNFVFWLFAR